jgi:hypothetical protein
MIYTVQIIFWQLCMILIIGPKIFVLKIFCLYWMPLERGIAKWSSVTPQMPKRFESRQGLEFIEKYIRSIAVEHSVHYSKKLKHWTPQRRFNSAYLGNVDLNAHLYYTTIEGR